MPWTRLRSVLLAAGLLLRCSLQAVLSAFDRFRLTVAGRTGSTPAHRRAVAALSVSPALVLAACGSVGSTDTPAAAQASVGSLLGAAR